MCRLITFVAAAVVSLSAVAGVSYAQPKAAVTDPAEADADFAVQGEYAGWLYNPARGNEWMGLQVVALGDGKFDAVSYRGGLPGAGWDRAGETKLSSQLEGTTLMLTGSQQRFVLSGGAAIAVDTAGRELGRLNKVDRRSPTLGLQPPARATVLFDGRSTEHLQGAKVTPDGLLMAGVLTKMPVGAFRLHLEFRTPYMPHARGQGRANSGVYIQQRYEVQILDSFGLEGVANECGGLYRQTPPDINMCLPPLAWQSYDIWFTPPRFDAEGKKVAHARITVLHNGVPIHYHRAVTAKTGGGKPEGPEPLPINLQDHGNPVAFRNIWIVLGTGDEYVEASRGLVFSSDSGSYCQPRCKRGLLRRRCCCRCR
jgi:hypothetical protein